MGRISYNNVKGAAVEEIKNNDLIRNIVCNPFIISIIIVLIFLFISYTEPINVCSQGIYSFIPIIMLILAHDVIIRDIYRCKNETSNKMFQNTSILQNSTARPRFVSNITATTDDSINGSINESINGRGESDKKGNRCDPDVADFLNL